MVGSSFIPTDDVLPTILREEKGHVAYGEQQLQKMMETPEGRIAAQRSIDKWYVVGLDMFGRSESARDERYIEWGLKKRTNGKMREDYIGEMDPKITALGLRVPDKLAGRKYL
jgi:ring-1,2-phenylacetyl-CoA epoxidase subunit PaaA